MSVPARAILNNYVLEVGIYPIKCSKRSNKSSPVEVYRILSMQMFE